MLKGLLAKAKKFVFGDKDKGTSPLENDTFSKIKSAISGVRKLPVIIGGSILGIALSMFLIVVAYPEVPAQELLGTGNGSSSVCNEDPSKAEYVYEPLKGGLAIPHYHQIDERWGDYPMKNWDYNPPKDDTLAGSGCAFTSLAMVLSYLKDDTIYPPEVVDRLNGREAYGEINESLAFAEAAEEFGIQRPTVYLNWTSASEWNTRWQEAKEAIKTGHPVIAHYTGGGGIFTAAGHFVVIRGMNSDGTFLVNDPNDNSTQNSLGYKGAYINRHFTEAEITNKLDWIVIFEAKDCSTTSSSGGTGYLQWAIDIANDDSHGYNQCGDRFGNPDYDCSSLVYYSLLNNGYTTEQIGDSAFDTRHMDEKLTNAGFTRYDYNVSNLQAGDILWRYGHTGIYAGNGQVVEALRNENHAACYGQPGDQDGGEILVNSNSGNWTYYYRKE